MTGKNRTKAGRSGVSAALALVATALVALPSAGLAVGAANSESVERSESGQFASFTPANVDPRLAKLIANRSKGKGTPMRFTPAGIAKGGDRAVTVAVRVDGDAAQAISFRSAIAARTDQQGPAQIAVAPTRYDLGVSRGYQSFAQPRKESVLPEGLGKESLSKMDAPDLATFVPSEGVKEKPSRWVAHVQLEEKTNLGRAPRTAEGLPSQSVDVAGSFRLTRNLDVRAGLRYQQERDRLDPLINGEQDSQAVYVGTQFRF